MRIACAWEFIGHGSFGVLTKAAWVPYITVFGFSEASAWKLMPFIGMFDITLGLLTLILPIRICIMYMAFWGFFTATLRPLTGESVWELFERSYNFGLPALFLITHEPQKWWSAPWRVLKANDLLTKEKLKTLAPICQWIIASFLLSHGAFSVLVGKQNLLFLYWKVGLPLIPGHEYAAVYLLGCFEMLLGFSIVFYIRPSLLMLIIFWKVATEAFYPLSHSYGGIFEFIERGSSYGTPLLLLLILKWTEEPQLGIIKMSRSRSLVFSGSLIGLCLLFNWHWNSVSEKWRDIHPVAKMTSSPNKGL